MGPAPSRVGGFAPRESGKGRHVNQEQKIRIAEGVGFFAALDQSGGSSPKALAEYGIDASAYSSDEEMFGLMHAMRARVVRSPVIGSDRLLAAILFEQTMHREVDGQLTGDFLWEQKGIVPFVKVDKGTEDVAHGVQLMKPNPTLDETLEAAVSLGMFGTKMRSVIHEADPAGVAAIADQQFEVAAQIAAAGLVPILEPEVSIRSATKDAAERLLLEACLERLADVPATTPYMFKITIPNEPGLYAPLAAAPQTLRVLALSGGYSRDEACTRLAADGTLIASFSRALLAGLTAQQSDEEFDRVLEESVAAIYAASR
jgi:fructose-bisphosphate aldolase class I